MNMGRMHKTKAAGPGGPTAPHALTKTFSEMGTPHPVDSPRLYGMGQHDDRSLAKHIMTLLLCLAFPRMSE